MENRARKQLSPELIDWYWAHGFAREGRYALPKGDWLNRLYRLRDEGILLEKALESSRPSVAIWGPSQTGKSTLVSRYIDAPGDPATGKGTALHWEEGTPSLFLAPSDPEVLENLSDETVVLNPFNSGLDASACLTRFTHPSVFGGKPPFPEQPVEIRFVDLIDLVQSLARGYDSQCMGPADPKASASADPEGEPPRFPTTWTSERFAKVLRKYREKPVPRGARPQRESYERLQGLCRIVDDLIFAELERFRSLASGEVRWSSLRREILSDSEGDSGAGSRNALLYDAELAESFVAEILWDGYPVMTELYRGMRERRRELQEKFGDKPVYCSLEVAALFLDMESYTVLLKPIGGHSRAKDRKIHDRAPKVGYREEGGAILLGVGGGFSQPLIQKAEDFGILQGLVWEMVVPLNPGHLEDTSFRKFLETSDLLDFPGVERGGQGASVGKIDLDILGDRRTRGVMHDDEHDPYQFYIRILKRGKTSCIVSTYAKKLTIDGFCIFQDLDRDKPNAGELVTGIQTWWRSVAPEFYRNPQGESPLPLNFVLLWWATLFNEGHRMGTLVKKLAGLGPIADSDYASVFALNYYGLSRGKVQEAALASMNEAVGELKADPAFARLFKRGVSQQSFDQMIADLETGGTDFFFGQLQEQMAGRESDSGGRQELLDPRREILSENVRGLLQEHELVPEPKPKDERREHLEAFLEAIREALPLKTERELRRLNHDLRRILNIDYMTLSPIPTDPLDISVQYLRNEIGLWANQQVQDWAEMSPASRPNVPGINERTALANVLHALVQSLEPDLEDVSDWLRKLAGYARTRGFEDSDLRRPLALRLGNALLYGEAGVRVRRADDLPLEMGAERPRRDGDYQQSPSYRFFLAGFIGPKGQLEYLINRQVVPSKRPDQPGDEELVALLDGFGVSETEEASV